MSSWIYIFSKFTPEALLFEAAAICVLCVGYSAYWVLKKRKYGVLGQETPAYAVKSYLNQLILDAEQMRIQLFGLLAGTGVDPALMAQLRAGTGASVGASSLLASLGNASASDPELGAKLAAIEAKMVEQAKAMETITGEKVRLEKELVEVRAGKGGTPAASGADPKLAEKIKALEAKLAEYSVIEDDLANLKRLQQENVQLKAQLSGKEPVAKATAAAPAAAASSAVPANRAASAANEDPTAAAITENAPAPEAAAGDGSVSEAPQADTPAGDAPVTEAPAAAAEAAPGEAQAEAAAVAATDAAITEAAGTEPIAQPTGDAGFEGLVDQVEQSLTEPAAEAPAEAAAGASVTDPTTSAAAPTEVVEAGAAAPTGGEKTDADLVAEFEKMLNS